MFRLIEDIFEFRNSKQTEDFFYLLLILIQI